MSQLHANLLHHRMHGQPVGYMWIIIHPYWTTLPCRGDNSIRRGEIGRQGFMRQEGLPDTTYFVSIRYDLRGIGGRAYRRNIRGKNVSDHTTNDGVGKGTDLEGLLE